MIPESVSNTLANTPDPFACAAFLVSAFALAGCAHVLWLRSEASMKFKMPLDGGRSFAGNRIFGDHKMLRGFVVMVPAAAISFGLLYLLAGILAPRLAQSLWPLSIWRYVFIGFLAGLGFMAGELPNSFVKRRLGIPPGGTAPPGVCRGLIFVLDRVDSTLGVMLMLSLVVRVPAWTWVYAAVAGVGLHWIFSAVLFVFGVKERMA